MPQTKTPRFIDKADQLTSFCTQARNSPWLALDTEFVRERTYYPELCLIQLATADGEIACIDTLALPELQPLFELLAAPGISKILHAVGQDLEVLYLNNAPRIAPLFDTQLAAGLLGLGDQIGYAGLVKQLCNVELAKGHARTDWSRRPLSAEQLKYAADDVRYLGQMYETLAAQLENTGRSDWLAQDVQALSDPANFEAAPDQAWQRLKGLSRLPAAAQHRAARLAAWREQRAMDKNRPRRWVLADAPLLELANRAPRDRTQLNGIADLPTKLIEQQGDALLSLLREQNDSDQPLVTEWRKPDAQEKAVHKRLKAAVREVAEELDISPTLLARRSDIEGLVEGRRELPVLRGWRAEVIGATLLSALEEA